MMNFISHSFFAILICAGVLSGKSFAQTGPAKKPILILNKQRALGAYTGEILKAEGFNEFDLVDFDLESVSANTLKVYDLLILPRLSLSKKQVNKIIQYVKNGGNLIAFLPDAALIQQLNAGSVADSIQEGYLQIQNSNEIGKGLLHVPLKFHGAAIFVDRSPAKVIASFYPAVQGKQWPALVAHRFGKGQALCFFYDLPENILMTRQGNPADAGKEMDGILGLRAMDLFTNHWVDTTMNCLNHADEQLRLLTHGIEFLSRNKKPLPRFWYFPDSLTCLTSLTNDGEDNKQEDFIQQFKDVGAKGAKMSLYVLRTDKINRSFTDSLVREGHEVAGHPDATRYAEKPDWSIMTKAIRDKFAELKTYQSISNVITNVNHWFVWCGTDSAGNPDFTAEAKIESNEGIKLDMNYAHYDNNSNQSHFLGAMGKRQGNFAGSGLPMRFADMQGSVIDIFQHFNNVYDQQYMEHKDKDGFFECFKGLVDRSLDEEVYSYISVKAHNNEYFFSKDPLLQMLDYANKRNVPVWTAAKLYQFLRVKDEAGFSDLTLEKQELSFTVHTTVPNPNGLSFLLPFSFNGRSVSTIQGNGLDYPLIKKKIKGVDYAWVIINPGQQYAFRIGYL